MGKLIGYVRVSKGEQNTTLQIDALLKVGCLKKDIYVDKVSGSKSDRHGLAECIQKVSSGDTLVVWRLDRLGRSLTDLIHIIEQLQQKDCGFKSISDGYIDTTTASGELIFHIFSSLAQFEKRLIQERTKAGLSAARSRGRVGGRPALNPHNPKIIAAKKMHKDNNMPIRKICEHLNVSRGTLYRYLKVS